MYLGVWLVGVVQRRTHLNCRRMQSASKLIVIIIVSVRCLVAAVSVSIAVAAVAAAVADCVKSSSSGFPCPEQSPGCLLFKVSKANASISKSENFH